MPTIPLPSLPIPTIPLPSIGIVSTPRPDPSDATPAPSTDGAEPAAPSGSTDASPSDGERGSAAPSSSPGAPAPSSAGGGTDGTRQDADRPAPGSDAPAGGIHAVAAVADVATFDLGQLGLVGGVTIWVVPAAVLGVPGALVIAWVMLQAIGVLAWVPAMRRLRGEPRSVATG